MRDTLRAMPTMMPIIGRICAIFMPTRRAPRAANKEFTDAVSALFPTLSIDPRLVSLRTTLLNTRIEVAFSTAWSSALLRGAIAWDKTIAENSFSAGSFVSYP